MKSKNDIASQKKKKVKMICEIRLKYNFLKLI